MNIDLDDEFERNPEYRRILAELSPDERLRLLGLDFNLQRQLVRKREYRRALAKLSPVEKLRVVEELRKRAEMQRGLRQAPPLSPPPMVTERERDGRPRHSVTPRKIRPSPSKAASLRFGGRATAGGVNYEARVAAFIAVKMLAGAQCWVWEEISGAEIAAITMQAPEPVDDIVVNLRGDTEARVFISAKERSGNIALMTRSPAFAETVDAFVRQFLTLLASARPKCRLLWAVPACVGRAATHDLPTVLKDHRDVSETLLSEFSRGRQTGRKQALEALLRVATGAWKRQSGHSPTEDELRHFLRQVFVEVYDFGPGHRLQREIEGEIGSHIVADPKQARRAWEKLEHSFLQADCHGVSVNAVSLRKALIADGIALKSAPDYASDIARLRALTAQNLTRLKEHTTLSFGPQPRDNIHIARSEELSALLEAVKAGHLLVTGEPGCGKSGLIHALVEALQEEGSPVVLLLAEDILPTFSHPLDELIANWPDGPVAFLIIDALDAVRDFESHKAIRRLLRDVQQGQSGWTVVASVREFDLKHSRELRELFPGNGVAGYACNDFAGVAHFHVPRLSEGQLDDLVAKRLEIRPFITNARTSPKSGGVHRSPFYLRLAAELLHTGVNPTHLSDWHSPALLLRRFWEVRIKEGAGTGERENVLKAVCRKMLDTRRMAVSLKQLPLAAPERSHVDKLRSRGILQSPAVRHGTQVGADEIRFTHHLLHDYAIARSLIPETPQPFCDFAIREPLLPIFYRQSFMFALEELWDAPDGRSGFWEAALKLESVPQLHGTARILAPILAARRVESLADLQRLLTAVASATDAGSACQKALQHLASGLQDADEALVRAGASGWCEFAEQLASLLSAKAWVEGPLVHIIARLNAVSEATNIGHRLALNAAGRGLLTHHVAKEVSKGWPYAAAVAIEAVCRTFEAAPVESERALLTLLTPRRLERFPHFDLHDLANNLRHLGANGDNVVLRLFDAAFSREPEPGNWEQRGSAIMGMRFQTSDEWSSVHYALARYYKTRNATNAALMTEAACMAWNAVVRRRRDRRDSEDHILGKIEFRGVQCDLVEDYSHIWGREFEHEENRILSHFEKVLREWAAAGDTARLSAALDRFAVRNRTSLMWSVLMEVGAECPATLGVLLADVLNEPVFLTHPDYAYGATALLGALHEAGDTVRRERLERLVLDLPKNVWLHKDEPRDPVPSWVTHAQDRLLGVLKESHIVLGTVRELWLERRAVSPLPPNRKPEGVQVISRTLTAEELVEEKGIDLKEPANEEMLRLRKALGPLLGGDEKKVAPAECENYWHAIEEGERAVRNHGKTHPKMAEELWGHLVGACEHVARRSLWPATSDRWKVVRRILLKAATHPVPQASEEGEDERDDSPSWVWPAPRLDAARGLPWLAFRLGQADRSVASALRRLARDKSHPLRFNLAIEVAVLEKLAPDLMWELIDTFIASERKYSVLDALLRSMDRLWARGAEKLMPRLKLIAERALQSAPAENGIHETLACVYLFRFLRTGDAECEEFIRRLIAECDSERAARALIAQLHSCRQGGWLTAGDAVKLDPHADAIRSRTWRFFSELLAAVQAKVKAHREAWMRLHEHDQPDPEAVKSIKDKLDRTMRLVDAIASQLYYASGAFDEQSNMEKQRLTPPQLQRFWQEASALLTALSAEIHPHTAHYMVQTLYHLLPCSPREVFLLATRSIRSSATAGFQHESLAVGDVVKLIQRALADHREIFQIDSECLSPLLEVLDLFVEAGWAEARQLTHRLEEIYR